MYRFHSLWLAILLMVDIPVAFPALTINLTPSSGTYTAGETGFLSVLVHSNNSPNDQLDSFLMTLNITGGPGVTFTNPQPESYLTDGNYVFSNRSANVAFNLNASNVTNAGATLTAGDVSYDFTPATLGNPFPRIIPDSTSPLLLGRFPFLAAGPGNYSIGLDLSSSFSNASFIGFAYGWNGTSFTVTAVPEPGSLALLTAAGAAGAAFRYRRQRRRRGLS